MLEPPDLFRWIALGVLMVAMAISGTFRRRARREGGTIARRRESTGLILLRALMALPVFGGILAFLIHPPWMAWSTFTGPEWLPWVGVALGVMSLPMLYWLFSAIGKNISETVLTKEDHELVTHGPYRWIRHPLYSTGLALIGSLGLMAGNWFILLGGLVVAIAIRFVVVPAEERALIGAFGDRYRDYIGRTGRLLPGLGRES